MDLSKQLGYRVTHSRGKAFEAIWDFYPFLEGDYTATIDYALNVLVNNEFNKHSVTVKVEIPTNTPQHNFDDLFDDCPDVSEATTVKPSKMDYDDIF